MNGIERIAAERQRQIEEVGWSPDHDEAHIESQLALAAVVYALPETWRTKSLLMGSLADALWPCTYVYNAQGEAYQIYERWQLKFSPENRVRELEKAGALIAAEIDRLLPEKEQP